MLQGMSRAALFAVLALMLVASLSRMSFGALPNTVSCAIIQQQVDMGTCLVNAIPIAMVGVLFSLSLVAVSYMFDAVIHIPSMRNWYRNELKETAKSLMIIIIAISALALLSGIASVVANTGTTQTGTSPSTIQSNLGNLYDAASNYITVQQGKASDAYSFMTGLSVGIGLLKTAQLYLWIPFPLVPDFIIPPTNPCIVCLRFGSDEFLYQSTIIDTSSITAVNNLAFIRDVYEFLVLPVFFVFTVQQALLPVLMQVGLLLFFPIGIILRAIPFVRGIGGTLIAIGLTLSLIYPFVLVAFNVPVTSAINKLVTFNNGAPQSCSINVLVIGDAICWIFTSFTSVFSGSIAYVTGLGAGITSLTSIYPAFDGIQYYTFNIGLQFILTLLDVVIVVTAAQNIAKMLGGSIRLGLGGRLKLA